MTLQSEFAATLVDEFVRAGVHEVVVAPGSRSSPLALAFVSDERIRVHVRLDERSGAYFALGNALGSNRPGVIVTTSGTASAEVHAAVIEADLARVPLIVLTADRPPELYDVGAPQTIGQVGLYGNAPRFSCAFPVPDATNRSIWRSMTSRLVFEAMHGPLGPGPVHANLPFREPLVGAFGELSEGRANDAPWHARVGASDISATAAAAFAALIEERSRGLFLCGGGAFLAGEEHALLSLAEHLGWPVLADGRAFARSVHPNVVVHGDAIFRSESARDLLFPEIVIHVGAPHASRIIATFFGEAPPGRVEHVTIDPYASFEDPERLSSNVIASRPAPLFSAAAPMLASKKPASDWLAHWRLADDAAETAIERLCSQDTVTEPGIARAMVAQLPADATLFCSSSMPIRDVEWFSPARANPPTVLSNRGANGIDGVVSTVLGVAATSDGPVVGLLGDLAFFYDLSGLVFGVSEEVPSATLVVIDNSGGGIFSFLAYPGIVEKERFERAFGTRQSPSVAAVASALGARVIDATSPQAFAAALSASVGEKGVTVVVVHTDRDENVAFHDALNRACVEAIDAALRSDA